MLVKAGTHLVTRRCGALAVEVRLLLILAATIFAWVPAAEAGQNSVVTVSNSSTVFPGGLFFTPSTVNIIRGDTVVWCWANSNCTGTTVDNHSTSSGTCTGSTIFDHCSKSPVGGEQWDSGDTTSGSFGHTFNNAGSFTYFCDVHTVFMQGSVNVAPFGTTAGFVVSPSTGSPTAGAQFTVTVTAVDRNGNAVPTYPGNLLTFSSSDGSATFSLNTNWSGGVLIENVTLHKSGSQSVTASNTDGSGTGSVTVQPAAIDHFLISTPPTTVGFNTIFTVTAYDAFDNIKTDYAGTVHFTVSPPGTATVPPDSTFSTSDNGIKTFGVTFSAVGSEMLSVADTIVTSATGNATFTVNPASCIAAQDRNFNNGPATVTFDSTPSTSAYPSTLSVSMAAGQVIGKLTVTVHGLVESANAANVEMLLVGPKGKELVIMSGAGSGAIPSPGIDLTFDDSQANLLPQSSALSSGSFRPTTYKDPNFAAIAGGPAGPYPESGPRGRNTAERAIFTLEAQFAGTDPNGTWSLYVLDAGSGSSGSITAWSLDITPGYAASNPASISFTSSPASTAPYPSPITVSGVPGNIARVSLVLNQLTDICPELDAIMLQGPQGQLFVPASDAGDCGIYHTATSHQTTVFGDEAFSLWVSSVAGTLTGGFFKPTSSIRVDFGLPGPVFVAPAPPGPYPEAANDGSVTFTSAFGGKDPNGVWNLYFLYQDKTGVSGEAGSLAGGWGLIFELQCPTCTASVTASTGTSSTFNQPVTLNGTAGSDFEVPGGMVTFCDGAANGGTCTGTSLGTATLDGSGHATLAISTLAVGGHSITLNYPGGSVYPAATSPPLDFTVAPGPTATSLMSSANPSTFAQSVTFTAKVVATGFGGSPTGTVTFKDGAATLGTATLAAGAAALPYSALTAGSHTITASYSGDGSFNAGTSNSVAQMVNKAASSVTLVSSQNPSVYGADPLFTATVHSSNGVTPTSTVNFMDGASSLGVVNLSSGQAALVPFPSLSAGPHTISAVYNGDGDFTGSTSSNLAQTVSKASSSSKVISLLNPSSFGQSVSFIATVTSGSGSPTGTVTFLDGASSLGSGTLNTAHHVALTTTTLSAASHNITVAYAGDGNFSASASSIVVQTVNQAFTSTALTSALSATDFRQSNTLTATVTSAGGTVDGTVTFMDGNRVLGSRPLAGGTASLTVVLGRVGLHLLTAIYNNSTNFAASTSTALGLYNSAQPHGTQPLP